MKTTDHSHPAPAGIPVETLTDSVPAPPAATPLTYQRVLNEAPRRLPLSAMPSHLRKCVGDALVATVAHRQESLDAWPQFLAKTPTAEQMKVFAAEFDAARRLCPTRVFLTPETAWQALHRIFTALQPIDFSELPEKFCHRLRWLLARRGFGHAQIARMLKIRPDVIGRWCSDDTIPQRKRIPVLVKLEQLLDVPPGTLTGMAELEHLLGGLPDNQATDRTLAGHARAYLIKEMENYPVFDEATQGTPAFQAELQSLLEHGKLAEPDFTRPPILNRKGKLAAVRAEAARIVQGDRLRMFWTCCVHHGHVPAHQIRCGLLLDPVLLDLHLANMQRLAAGGEVTVMAVRFVAYLVNETVPGSGWFCRHPEAGRDAHGNIPSPEEWAERCAGVHAGLVARLETIRKQWERVDHRRRLREPVQPILDAQLYAGATAHFLRALQRAALLARGPQRQFTAARDYALMATIVLLNVSAPVAAAMNHGEQLRRQRGAPGGYWFHFTWAEVGVTGSPCSAYPAIDEPVPGPAHAGAPSLAEAYALYLAAARRAGVSSAKGAPVFSATKRHRGRRYRPNSIHTQFHKLTKRAFGRWTPRGFGSEQLQLLARRHLEKLRHPLAEWILHPVATLGRIPDQGTANGSDKFQDALNLLGQICFGPASAGPLAPTS